MNRRSSAYITVACMLVGGLALYRSQQPKQPDMDTFHSADECVASNLHSKEDCQRAFNEAQNNYQLYRTTFNSLNGCEQVYGVNHCTNAGTGLFAPMMLGFAMAHMANREDRRNENYYSGGHGLYVTSGNRTASSGYGSYGAGGANARGSFGGEEISRGGFGRAGRGFSFHG